MTASERFWSKVDRSGECWAWSGYVWPNGYGGFWRTHKLIRAHRFAYEEFHGRPVPKGHDLHHTCENRACVNPDHLVATTRQEHMRIHLAPRRLEICPKCGGPRTRKSDRQSDPHGWFCRPCHASYQRKWRVRRRLVA